jgi:hypothetical protein
MDQGLGHLGLEAAQVLDDLARLGRLLGGRVGARQLRPAIGAHGLQFGVALEGGDGLVEPAELQQRQTEAVPGRVELGVALGGLAEGSDRLVLALQLRRARSPG